MRRASDALVDRSQSGVRLSEVVAAMSLAADLGLGQPMEHVLRSCLIASRSASALGFDAEDQETTYWVTLLVTVGCTGVSYELTPLFGDDIAWRSRWHDVGPSALAQLRYHLGRAGHGMQQAERLRIRVDLLRTGMGAVQDALVGHCRLSARLSDEVGLGPRVSAALSQTFARWDGKGVPRGLRGTDIVVPMQLCQIADAVEVWHREEGIRGAVARVRASAGSAYDPALAEAWCGVAPSVLASLAPESSWDAVIAGEPRPMPPLTDGELDAVLEVVADFADLKSPWFAGHSRGVADLSSAAARASGIAAGDVRRLRRAALLHDLGRNGVPNSIWDKPGALTETELERARLHAYFTDRVVRRAGGLAHLAPIASGAHERSDGSGYPRGTGSSASRLAELLEAADAYHAMLEPRPHRPALPPADAALELRGMARAGVLRGPAVDAVLSVAGHAAQRSPSAPAGLTPRELDVLIRVARGATLRQVGEQLSISPKTAGNHLERVYTKIGVSTRAEATLFAMQHELLGPG